MIRYRPDLVLGSLPQGSLYIAAQTSTTLPSLVLTSPRIPSLPIARTLFDVCAEDREDWYLSYCACGDGNNEPEALDRLETVTLERSGATVALSAPDIDSSNAGGCLLVRAPADVPIIVHASYTPVFVQEMRAPIFVTAIHARARILNTMGKLNVAGSVIDYVGSEGIVLLSAKADINVRITAQQFTGTYKRDVLIRFHAIQATLFNLGLLAAVLGEKLISLALPASLLVMWHSVMLLSCAVGSLVWLTLIRRVYSGYTMMLPWIGDLASWLATQDGE